VVDDLYVGFRGLEVLHGVSLHVAEGEVVALLGRNGAGKTTTLRAVIGELPVEHGAISMERAGVETRLKFVLDLFPKLAERSRQRAWSLSGGEQQMLTIARALMNGPELLLLDEPSLGLAPKVVSEVFDALASLRAIGVSILLVEQNARKALQLSARVYVLAHGRIAAEGTVQLLRESGVVEGLYFG